MSDKLILLKLLLSKKPVLLDAKDNQDRTPLHTAARFGCSECVSFLLSRGARVDAICTYGRTPLHKAAWHWRDNIENLDKLDAYQQCIVLLINYRADTHLLDKDKPITHKEIYNKKSGIKQGTPVSTMPIDDAIDSYKRWVSHVDLQKRCLEFVAVFMVAEALVPPFSQFYNEILKRILLELKSLNSSFSPTSIVGWSSFFSSSESIVETPLASNTIVPKCINALL